MRLLVGIFMLLVITPSVRAHHSGWGPMTLSPKCGWLEGDNIRDLTNVRTFCAQSIPAALRVQAATANREYLWVDAPRELTAALRENDSTTETILRDWLHRWRAISGYPTAFVIVLRNHVEIARAGTAMRGDFVTVQ
jgi:hypothetical protein